MLGLSNQIPWVRYTLQSNLSSHSLVRWVVIWMGVSTRMVVVVWAKMLRDRTIYKCSIECISVPPPRTSPNAHIGSRAVPDDVFCTWNMKLIEIMKVENMFEQVQQISSCYHEEHVKLALLTLWCVCLHRLQAYPSQQINPFKATLLLTLTYLKMVKFLDLQNIHHLRT